VAQQRSEAHHYQDPERVLQQEIDEFVRDAFHGTIPKDRMKFEANKVYKKKGNPVATVKGDIGVVFPDWPESIASCGMR
jgi:hypothetical protein